MASRWIASAIKRPGALTARARAAGLSPLSFARIHRRSKGLVGRQSRLALQLAKFARQGRFRRRRK